MSESGTTRTKFADGSAIAAAVDDAVASVARRRVASDPPAITNVDHLCWVLRDLLLIGRYSEPTERLLSVSGGQACEEVVARVVRTTGGPVQLQFGEVAVLLHAEATAVAAERASRDIPYAGLLSLRTADGSGPRSRVVAFQTQELFGQLVRPGWRSGDLAVLLRAPDGSPDVVLACPTDANMVRTVDVRYLDGVPAHAVEPLTGTAARLARGWPGTAAELMDAVRLCG